MSRYFLGVDGGQSSTTALIGDESGEVLGYGRGGPCNHVKGPEGLDKFTRAIGDCLAAACETAGLDAAVDFRAACLGFSGGPADKEQILAKMFRTAKLIVTDDALIALTGAAAGGPGIIAIAGTGSIAYGRNSHGRTARAGGWGYIFGDEGGGFDLTRQALRAALRTEEGWGPPTLLRERLMEAAGATDANDLLHRFYTVDYPRPRIASFARLVDACAREGDAVARDILHNAAQQLAVLAAAVRSQLFTPGEYARVSPIGGVWNSEIFLQRFHTLVEFEEGNEFGKPLYGPAAGALIEAYRAVGLAPELSFVPEFEK